ncbi:MAG: hypothetical protein GF364_00725 [Candidatus Lokiarchaeota archaeon]|nr:hypothetical protein [Candidatus Lokiarchaeota archaeon]
MSDSKKILKAGLIGTGSSATNIAETIASLDIVEMVGIADVNVDGAKSLAEKYNVEYITKNYEELCKKDNIDFIIISTPHALHYKMAKCALENNKHVLTEKPITTKISHAEDLIKVAREKKLKLGVHFQCRFFGAVKKAEDMINSGVLGKILQVNVSVMWHRPHEYYDGSNWKGKWDLEGGSSLINQAIHPLDEMVHLVGEVKTLFGLMGVKYHNIETEDNTAAAFVFQNGAFGTLQTSTATKAAFPAKLTIFGVEGGLEIDGNILTYHKADGTSEVTDFTAGGQVGSAKDPKLFSLKAHSALMEDFCDAIINDRKPTVNGEEGIKSLKVVRAVYESNGEKIIHL